MRNKKNKRILKTLKSNRECLKAIRKLTKRVEKIIKSEKDYNRIKFKKEIE